jgi:hypothetical protein
MWRAVGVPVWGEVACDCSPMCSRVWYYAVAHTLSVPPRRVLLSPNVAPACVLRVAVCTVHC